MPYFKPVNPEQPIVEKLFYYKGTTFKFWNQSQDQSGDPYDFTGHTFNLYIKEQSGDADADAVVTLTEADVTLSASSAGSSAGVDDIYEFSKAPAAFANLIEEPYKYFWVLEVTDGSGEVFNHYKGDFIVKSD